MQTKTDADILKWVAIGLGFNTNDLEANRLLHLSGTQQRELRREQYIALIILLICVIAIISGVIFRTAITYALAIGGAIFGVLIGYFLLKVYLNGPPDTLAMVEGLMTREKRTSLGRDRDVFYYLRVADKTFGVEQGVYDLLERDVPVRAYYLLGSGSLINLELWPQ